MHLSYARYAPAAYLLLQRTHRPVEGAPNGGRGGTAVGTARMAAVAKNLGGAPATGGWPHEEIVGIRPTAGGALWRLSMAMIRVDFDREVQVGGGPQRKRLGRNSTPVRHDASRDSSRAPGTGEAQPGRPRP